MYEKIVLVTRKTRLEDLVERFNTRAQARFYINHSGGDFEFYEREHETYHRSLDLLRSELHKIAKLQSIERGFLPNFLFAKDDLVVTIGIDGLVVNTAKYLNGQPVVAVNPDPEHIDGILLPFDVTRAPEVVRTAMDGEMQVRAISMAQAQLNDGQSLLAFNDLFIGVKSHVSARYQISLGERTERHSSSGVIISTGAGSTGWLSSMFNMTNGMARYMASSNLVPEIEIPQPSMDWESDTLFFVVREPFVSKTSAAEIVCGEVTPELPLVMESHIPQGGVIFSDGVEVDYLDFNAGSVATVQVAEVKTNLVVR